MRIATKLVDIPIGRVELFGLVLHIVEHNGRLVAACPDDNGSVVSPLAASDTSVTSYRRLMRSAVDLLLNAAETELAAPNCRASFAAQRCKQLAAVKTKPVEHRRNR